jgi:NDP-sugar pyrophosphorylase family protein
MYASREVMPAVILAGGLATRLQPLTQNIPKALIQVADHPFLWHQLMLLKRRGVRSIILLVGHLGEMIVERFGDGSALELSIQYCFDGPILLGTAGAIRKALPLLPPRFFVLYGDSYLTCDYEAIESAFACSGAPALMTVYRNQGRFDTSNVEFDGKNILRYDKKAHSDGATHHIDYGLGAFDREVFSQVPEGEVCDLASVYQKLLKAHRLAAYEVYERFYEIGSPDGLRDTEAYIKSSRSEH